jgi:hypothetical protein
VFDDDDADSKRSRAAYIFDRAIRVIEINDRAASE